MSNGYPTVAPVEHARRLDPSGDYGVAHAETLDLPDHSFDLAVCYLSLIDIAALQPAIAQIHRVPPPWRRPAHRQPQELRHGGRARGLAHEFPADGVAEGKSSMNRKKGLCPKAQPLSQELSRQLTVPDPKRTGS